MIRFISSQKRRDTHSVQYVLSLNITPLSNIYRIARVWLRAADGYTHQTRLWAVGHVPTGSSCSRCSYIDTMATHRTPINLTLAFCVAVATAITVQLQGTTERQLQDLFVFSYASCLVLHFRCHFSHAARPFLLPTGIMNHMAWH